MSDIKLVSEEYTSRFIDGPALDQKLANKQNSLSWYHESGQGGSIDPYKADMAANEVTLRAGLDTAGMINENTKISLSQEEGQISIESNYGYNGSPLQNILSTNKLNGRLNIIDIGEGDSSVYVNGPLYCDGELFCHNTLYDKNGEEITGGSGSGGSKWVTDGNDSGNPYVSLGKDKNGQTVNSIFICGPLYAHDSSSIFVEGPIGFNGVTRCNNSVFMTGPLYVSLPGYSKNGNAQLYISDQDSGGIHGFVMEANDSEGAYNYISSITLNSHMGSGYIRLRTGNTVLELDETKLNKLKELLES